MISEIDIYRAAQLYIDEYGELALSNAAKRIHVFKTEGNNYGEHLWNKIANAIQFIQNSSNLSDITCH